MRIHLQPAWLMGSWKFFQLEAWLNSFSNRLRWKCSRASKSDGLIQWIRFLLHLGRNFRWKCFADRWKGRDEQCFLSWTASAWVCVRRSQHSIVHCRNLVIWNTPNAFDENGGNEWRLLLLWANVNNIIFSVDSTQMVFVRMDLTVVGRFGSKERGGQEEIAQVAWGGLAQEARSNDLDHVCLSNR